MRTRFLMLKPSRPKTAGFHGLLWDFRAGKCLVKVLYICVYWASVLERGKFYSKSKKKSLSPQSPTILALGVYYTCILRFIIISHSFLKPSADQNSISHSQKKGGGVVQTLTNLGRSHKVLKANTLDVLKYQRIG